MALEGIFIAGVSVANAARVPCTCYNLSSSVHVFTGTYASPAKWGLMVAFLTALLFRDRFATYEGVTVLLLMVGLLLAHTVNSIDSPVYLLDVACFGPPQWYILPLAIYPDAFLPLATKR